MHDKSGISDSSNINTIVKVNVMWHFVSNYLELLGNTGAVFDKEFMRYYKQLQNYVYGKMQLPVSEDILDEYVVYEVGL